jgi:hypothetical protein
MERQTLDHSIIISAWRQQDDSPLTFICHEMGENSVAIKSFCPLEKGTELKLNFQFWDRSVQADGAVVDSRPYNGAYEGVLYYQMRGGC